MEKSTKSKTIKETLNLYKNVKSLNIIKHILSFLSRNEKLNLIAYNKNLQNKLGINIEYYKQISGRYKIIDTNGKGKEYELITNQLLFEGEYRNGKRNGKGIELYGNGDIKFEGEYLNGKRYKGKGYNIERKLELEIEKDGSIKEYYSENKLKFEGKIFYGRKWNGKGFNYEGKEEYEIKNGKGYVKEYDYEGKLLFEGEYINGERNGKGKEYFNIEIISDKDKKFFPFLSGNILKDLDNKNFLFFNPNIKYNNENLEENMNQKRIINKIKFEGEYLNGKRWNGKGFNHEGKEVFKIENGDGLIKEYNNKGKLILEGE